MESASNLSKNLKAFRSLEDKAQSDFAKEIGISKSTLQQIEQGKSPNLATIYCIAEHLGVPASALISDALPPAQTNILIHLLRGYDWFGASAEEQEALLSCLRQSSQLLARMKERLEALP